MEPSKQGWVGRWTCSRCGHSIETATRPGDCPECGYADFIYHALRPESKVAPTITKGWQAQLDRIRTALNAALEELDDNEGDPRTCIEYALIQLQKLGLFGGLKEKEGDERCM